MKEFVIRLAHNFWECTRFCSVRFVGSDPDWKFVWAVSNEETWYKQEVELICRPCTSLLTWAQFIRLPGKGGARKRANEKAFSSRYQLLRWDGDGQTDRQTMRRSPRRLMFHGIQGRKDALISIGNVRIVGIRIAIILHLYILVELALWFSKLSWISQTV